MKEITINFKGEVDNRGYGVYLGKKGLDKVLRESLPTGGYFATVSLKVCIEEEELKILVDGAEVKEEEHD